MFRFYTNAVSQASRSIAAGIFTVGLLLIGFGILILALPELFAMLAAVIFFIVGAGCGVTAIKIFLAQRQIDKINSDDSQGYRENVQIHIEDHNEINCIKELETFISLMSKDQRGKIGRNEPCPCGSGKKYKKCHGLVTSQRTSMTFPSAEEIKKIAEKLKAKEKQRTQQQGLGRPIISALFEGYRFVAVGSRFYYQKEEKWRTFQDFLAEYIKLIVGKNWGSAEQKKVLENRHPILQWAHSISEYRRKVFSENKGDIVTSPMTGAVFAYLTLAYNLYLIAHNTHLVHGEGLHARLIERLKNKESFYPAFYETMVAASFIKAGFQIELENEDEPISNHAEFVASLQKRMRNIRSKPNTSNEQKAHCYP